MMDEKKNHSNDPSSKQPIDDKGRYASDPNKSSDEEKEAMKLFGFKSEDNTPFQYVASDDSKQYVAQKDQKKKDFKVHVDKSLMEQTPSDEDMELVKGYKYANDLTAYDMEIIKAALNGKYVNIEEVKRAPLARKAAQRLAELKAKLGGELSPKTREDYDAIKAKTTDEARNKLLSPEYGAKKERKVFISLGLPASGKSSKVKQLLNAEQGYALIDSDEVKKCEGLAEYYDEGLGASVVQGISSEISNELMEEAISQGINIALPVVCGNTGRFESYIKKFHDAGYEISVDVNDTPSGICAARSLRRLAEDGRFVPFGYMMGLRDGRKDDNGKVIPPLKVIYRDIENKYEKGGNIDGIPIKQFTHSGLFGKKNEG